MPFCERLELSLTVWEGERLHSRLGGLATPHSTRASGPICPPTRICTPATPRRGPEPVPPRHTRAPATLWDAAASPRFPPSPGPTTRSWPAGDTDVTWLPIGVPETVEAADAERAADRYSPATDCIVTALAEFRADSSSRRAPQTPGRPAWYRAPTPTRLWPFPPQPLSGIHALVRSMR